MFTREEYRAKWQTYLRKLSGQISEVNSFRSEILMGTSEPPHTSARLEDCPEPYSYVLVERYKGGGPSYHFCLKSCPFCAYQFFGAELGPSESRMSFAMVTLMHSIRPLALDVPERWRGLVYLESVYLGEAKPDWQRTYGQGHRLLRADALIEDINLWADKTDEVLELSQRLDFNPITAFEALKSRDRSEIPPDILETLEKVVAQSLAPPEEVVAGWVRRKFADYESGNPPTWAP